MAKKKLFGNNIKPSCKYCELGTAGEGDKIHCSKMGDVKAYDSCKKFVYSPLKSRKIRPYVTFIAVPGGLKLPQKPRRRRGRVPGRVPAADELPR